MSSHQQQPNMDVDRPTSAPAPVHHNVNSSTLSTSSSNEKSKKRLTLDLKAPQSSSSSSTSLLLPNTASSDLKASPGFLLTSPDIQMLQLASPDLEKFIIQGIIGQAAQTPTPTQLLFPKPVTEEQESYAKGFVDALNALHRSGLGGAMSYNVVNTPGNLTAFPINNIQGQNLFPQFFALPQQQQFLQPMQQPQLQPHSLAHSQLMSSTNEQDSNGAKMEMYSPATSPSPSDPQTVPSDRVSTKSSNSSSGANADVDDQHRKKVERKRERNRVAAAKCRTRKLERIAELEVRVKELKDQNSQLSSTAGSLREEVERVRQELIRHMNSGCSVDVSAGLMNSLQQYIQS